MFGARHAHEASPGARSTFVAAAAVVGIEALAYAVVLPHLPVVVGQQAPWWAAGVLLAGYSIIQFLVLGPIGWMSQRFAERAVIAACLIGTAVGLLVTALSTNYWWLLVGRIVDGASAGTVVVVTAATLSWFPPQRWTKVLGSLGAIRGAAALVGVTVTAGVGIVLAQPDRSLSTMAWVGIALVAVALAFVPFVRPATEAWRVEGARSPITPTTRDALRRHIAAQAAQSGLIVLAPATGVTVASTRAGLAAPAAAIIGLAIGQVALATRMDRNPRLRLVMCVVLLAGVVLIPFSATVLAGFAIAGVAIGSFVPRAQALLIRWRISDGQTHVAANALAVRGSILGQIAGPTVGFVALTWSAALAALAVGAFGLAGSRRRPLNADP